MTGADKRELLEQAQRGLEQVCKNVCRTKLCRQCDVFRAWRKLEGMKGDDAEC